MVEKDSPDIVKEAYLDDKHLEYHSKQFHEPYQSTLHLCNFVKRTVDVNLSYEAIDVGCGGGECLPSPQVAYQDLLGGFGLG